MDEQPKTTDPVLALRNWLAQEGCKQHLPEMFYGPQAAFTQAVASPQGAAEIMPVLESIDKKLQGWNYYADLEPRWNLLQDLAHWRAGKTYDMQKILKALDQLGPTVAADCEPLPAEKELLRELVDAFYQTGEGGRQLIAWRPAHWHLLDFLAECTGRSLVTVKEERTPLLLANHNEGRVFVLVVERSFGPPGLISPDWWKLGLIPFGENSSFLEAVHRGFRSVIDPLPKMRMRLRWWLEKKHPATERWFDALGDRSAGENRSVEVAAACAAHALFDTKAPPETRPLLDESVAVSATLSKPGPLADPSKLPDALLLGQIEYAKNKKEAALRAKLSGVVFAAEQNEPEGPYGKPEEHIVYVRSAATFGVAYDSLLVTSQAVADYKAGIVKCWEDAWEEQPTPEEYRRGQSRDTE